MTRLALWVCIFSLSSGVAHAQQPLREFLSASSDHALDVRAARAALAQARAAVGQARGRLLPSFQAGGTITKNQKAVPINFGGQTRYFLRSVGVQANFGVSVPLVDIAGWANFFQNVASEAAADSQVGAVRQNVQVAVVQIWHQLVANRALIQAAQRNLDATEASRWNIQQRFEVGTGTRLDLSRATAQVQEARRALAEAQLQSTLAARNLQNLTFLTPSDRPVVLEDDGHPEPPLQHFMGRAGRRPGVRAARLRREAAQIGVTSAWLNYMPVITGQAQELYTNSPGFLPNPRWLLNLTATWTLGFVQPAIIEGQNAALDAAQVEVERAQQQAQTAIFESYNRMETARAQLDAARAAEEASRRAMEDAQSRYEAGAGTQLAVIEAQRDHFQDDVGLISAIATLRIARAALRLQSGLPVLDD